MNGTVQDPGAEWRLTHNFRRLLCWLEKHLCYRKDCYAKWCADLDDENKWRCIKEPLDRQVLTQHCLSWDTIGTYSTRPDDTCGWVGWDIDRHDGDKRCPDPAANLTYALLLYQRLHDLGLDCYLEDSNGRGGYHLVVIWNRPTPAAVAYSFAQWLVRDHVEQGVETIETFPKQASVKGRYGHQLRLPGKHHKKSHFSRFWDGVEWREGTAGIDVLVATQPSNPDLIPAEARDYLPPPPPRKERPVAEWLGEYDSEDWRRNYAGDLTTLDLQGLFEDHGMLRSIVGGTQEVTCPWHDQHTTGEQGTAIFCDEGKIPRFNCFHSHCQGRRIEDVLMWFGKEKVDAHCAKEYHNEDEELHRMEQELEKIIKGVELRHGAETRKRRGFRLQDFKDRKPPGWLLKDHLPSESLCLMYGNSGAGKSFLAIDMALSVASGTPYLGIYPVRPGPVLYLSGEGNSNIQYRIEAWMRHRGLDYPDDAVFVPFRFDLLDPVEIDEIVQIIQADLHGRMPTLIVVDTLARYFGGSDENNTKDMNAFVRVCDLMRERTGATVLIVHHTGWDTSRERGNKSLRNACDTVLAVEESHPAGSKIAIDKQKDAEPIGEYIVRRKKYVLGETPEGEEISSCGLDALNAASSRFQLLHKSKKQLLASLWQTFGGNSFTQADCTDRGISKRGTVSRDFAALVTDQVLRKTGKEYTLSEEVRGLLMRYNGDV